MADTDGLHKHFKRSPLNDRGARVIRELVIGDGGGGRAWGRCAVDAGGAALMRVVGLSSACAARALFGRRGRSGSDRARGEGGLSPTTRRADREKPLHLPNDFLGPETSSRAAGSTHHLSPPSSLAVTSYSSCRKCRRPSTISYCNAQHADKWRHRRLEHGKTFI